MKQCDDYSHPVAIGQAALLNRMPLDMTLRFYLQSLSTNLSSAAAPRLGLNKSRAQHIAHDLHPVIETVTKTVINLCQTKTGQPAYLKEIVQV